MRRVLSTSAMVCIIALARTGPAPCQTASHTFEDVSKAFICTYMEQWSSPNAEALPFMDSVFPDSAVYVNRTLNHAALLQAKRRFAECWPVRRFVARTDAPS